MKVLELVGERFGRLLVVERAANSRTGQASWLCSCDCGAVTVVAGRHLRAGRTRSCGCLRAELPAKNADRSRRHGHARGWPSPSGQSPTYTSWIAMRERCSNPNNVGWPNYGGRGIAVCARWAGPEGFPNFLADMGERPVGTSIDRIDNDGNYGPGNCRWATSSQQAQNRQRSA